MSSLIQQRRPAGGGDLLSLMRALDNYDSSVSSQLTDFTPRFDVRETRSGYHLAGELPSVEKRDVEIEFPDDKTLNIRGRTEHETLDDAEGAWWCAERSTGEFRRSFSFPRPVDRDHVEAMLKNGVLYIQIPKAEQDQSSFEGNAY